MAVDLIDLIHSNQGVIIGRRRDDFQGTSSFFEHQREAFVLVGNIFYSPSLKRSSWVQPQGLAAPDGFDNTVIKGERRRLIPANLVLRLGIYKRRIGLDAKL